MKAIIAKGRSIDAIRRNWAEQWKCLPEDIDLTILHRPGFFNRNWTVQLKPKVKVSLSDIQQGETRIVKDGEKYLIFPDDNVESIVPFPMVGKLMYKDIELFEEYKISGGEIFQYHPLVKKGQFSWELQVSETGSNAIAKVKHERPGRFVIKDNVTRRRRFFLENHVAWQKSDWCIKPEVEQMFKDELEAKGIVFGIIPEYWQQIIDVEGIEDVLIARQLEPVQPIDALLEDFRDNILPEIEEYDKIDYFASKLLVVEKDDIIAKKISGKDGLPGKDIFGKVLQVPKMKDIKIIIGKNVYLSEDGLEVKAEVTGVPYKLNNNRYLVEKVFIVNKDVDLETGSIEFPGDIVISRNVLDGLHVHSSGRVKIQGSVSSAEIKAESGISIGCNVFKSQISVGERHYTRSQFLTKLKALEERLTPFLKILQDIQNSIRNDNSSFKQIYRTILEKKYNDIPLLASELSDLAQTDDSDFFTREIIIAVLTVKYFVSGNGPFEIKDNSYLNVSLQEINNFLLEKETLVPEKVAFIAGYVQNSEIKSSGDFICRGDIYNSSIEAEANIKVYGACRVSKLVGGNKIFIYELGSADGGDDTIIRLPLSGHLTTEYCHPNVKIFMGKEYVPIEQTVRKLDIYIENGKLWVDKLKWLS